MMKRAIGLTLAGLTLLFLNGCASGPVDDTKFTRRGVSLAAMQSDSNHCWKLAQKSNISSDEATANVIAGTVLFGLVGATVAASSTQEAMKDPKNYHRRKVHDECMTRRGYKKVE
jgi:hypothetical protein